MEGKPSGKTLKEYKSQRKKTSLACIFVLYLYCLFWTLQKFGFTLLQNNSVNGVINLTLILSGAFSFILQLKHKRIYKKINMSNYREIKVFTRLEVVIYTIPVLISLYLVPLMIGFYLFILGSIYLGISQFHRPVDEIDRNRMHRL